MTIAERFSESCRTELSSRAAATNGWREALGFAPFRERDLVSNLESAWFDVARTPLANVRRAALQEEVRLALKMYGFPDELADPERVADELRTAHEPGSLKPTRATDLGTRIEFGEEIRDHLKQIVDFEHAHRPEAVPCPTDEFERLLLEKNFLELQTSALHHGLPLLRRLSRPTSSDEVELRETAHRLQGCRDAVQHLISAPPAELDEMLKKGFDVLQSGKKFKRLLSRYLGDTD